MRHEGPLQEKCCILPMLSLNLSLLCMWLFYLADRRVPFFFFITGLSIWTSSLLYSVGNCLPTEPIVNLTLILVDLGVKSCSGSLLNN